MARGNLIDWCSSTWEITNMESLSMTIADVCKPPKLGNLFISEPRTQEDSIAFCGKLKGQHIVMNSQQLFEELISAENLTLFEQCHEVPGAFYTPGKIFICNTRIFL